MTKRRAKLLVLGVLMLGAFAGLWVSTRAAAPVSMRVLEFNARQWANQDAQRFGRREYVVATVQLTNTSQRTITYWGYRPESPLYTLHYPTLTGWREKDTGRMFCGTGLERYTLAPSECITFQTTVDRDKPCKVAIDYTDPSMPSRPSRWPGWVAKWWPWERRQNYITTEAIDLRGTVGLSIKQPEPWLKPPDETATIQAAARKGDADAQFRLAGRYLTGFQIEKSLPEAMRWYWQAATNGHAEAAYNLGTIHEYGLGTSSDRDSATEWYRSASDRGHAGARIRLRALATQ
jgi:hypothetical protein